MAQHKDRPSAAAKPGGQDERIVVIDEAERAPDEEGRDEGDDAGQHHCRQHDEEKRVAAGKAETGEAVGDQADRQYLGRHRQKSNEQRIPQNPPKGQARRDAAQFDECLTVVLPHDRIG